MSKVTDLYGSMVFNEHVMRERLPKTKIGRAHV